MSFSATTTAVTTSSTSCPNTLGTLDNEGFVYIDPTVAFTGVTGLIQGSYDGTDYFGLQCYRASTGVVTNGGSTITLTDSTADFYRVPKIQGLAAIRFLSNGFSTGTCNVTVGTGVSGNGAPQTTNSLNLSLTDITAATTTLTGNLTLGASSKILGGPVVTTGGATAITTTRAVTKADSGGVFTTAQSSAYTITVAQPGGANERYQFQCIAPGAFDISIVATGCTFEGTITIDAATIPATGSTLKFASGAAILGDNIEIISTSTTKFLVRAIGSGAGGITIS